MKRACTCQGILRWHTRTTGMTAPNIMYSATTRQRRLLSSMTTRITNAKFPPGGRKSYGLPQPQRTPPMPGATTPFRTFAVQINFGQGAYKPNDQQAFKHERSDSQRKAAELQLQQISHSTNRILNMDTTGRATIQANEVQSLANEARVALHYWSSKWIVHHHPFCTVYPTHVKGLRYDEQSKAHEIQHSDEHCYGDYGPKQAERILEWILEMGKSYPQHKFVERILCDGSSGNAAFTNIIEAYLLPCTAGKSSTHDVAITDDFTQFSTSTGSHNINVGMWKPSINDACRVIDTMNELIENDDNAIEDDTNTNNAILYTWVKLSTLLGLDSASKSGSVMQSSDKEKLNKEYFGNTKNPSVPSSRQMKSVEHVIDSMERKLVDMEQRYFTTRKDSMKPNTLSYNHVVRGVLSGPRAADRAQWYLNRMERTEDRALGMVTDEDPDKDEALPMTTVFADEVTYNMAIYAISSEIHHRQSDSEIKLQMATKADSILKRMEQRYETTKRGEVQPTTISYSTVLKAWANAGIAVEAEKVLNKMIAVAENSTSGKARPNLICFNTVIGGWAKTKGRESAERAMNILEKMEKLSETRDYPDIFPDTITYSSVISAYARSGREDAGDHAEELLQRSLRLFHGGRKDLKPDTMTFCSVLDALSKQNRINKQNRKISSPDESEDARAEAVFERMKEMYKDGDTSVRPNVVAYNILLGVYADCMKSEKANALFEEMCQMYEAGDFHMKPDIISYNHYLFALANSFSRQNVDKAIDLLNKMENKINDTTKPNLSSYLAILKALAKQSKRYPDAAEKCEIIVKNMEDRYLRGESSVKPDIACYNCWIDVYSKSGSKDAASNALNVIERVITLSKDLDLRPDVVSFTTAMNAIANSNCAPDSAEALLDQMTELNIKPNKYTYNSFINVLARSGRNDAAERAEEILMKMRELSKSGQIDTRPDHYTFVAVINCWARSRGQYSAQRAERILHIMENRSANGDEEIRENRFVYGAVLNAWSKSGSAEAPSKALGILHRLEERYEQGDASFKPNLPIYNSVINTIAKSNSPTKAGEAEGILNRMLQAYKAGNNEARPNVLTYSTILNACAYTDGDRSDKMAAFKIAKDAMKEILGHYEPNEIIFATFLQACNRLIPPGKQRDQLIQSVFKECCQNGLVNVKVILTLRRALSREKLDQALHGTPLANGMVTLKDIPFDWRKRVR